MNRTLSVMVVVGTRPEAIKMAPVVAALAARPAEVHPTVVVTGQHRQMLDQVLSLFAIRPDVDLDVMRPNQSLAGLTAVLLERLDRAVRDIRPDWVLAQGDTTTVMATSLVSFYGRVRFGHVEAGLRTYSKYSPFPEEVNRRIADLLADAYFAPTERARQVLLREGCSPERVHLTGNTVVDALLDVASRPYDWVCGPLAEVPRDRRLVLVTAHRRESFGAPLVEVCAAIRDLAKAFADDQVHVVYPVHLNPNVQEPVRATLSGLDNVSLLPPLDYLSLVHLMKRSQLVLTDSGGIQEEAPTFGVPVLVMRDTTERPEGVEAGVVRLVGTDRDRITAEASRLLRDPDACSAMRTTGNPYGDGRASERIVSELIAHGLTP